MDLQLSEAQRDELLKTTMADKIPSDLEGMESTLQTLLVLIDDVYKYVDDVVVRTLTQNSCSRVNDLGVHFVQITCAVKTVPTGKTCCS